MNVEKNSDADRSPAQDALTDALRPRTDEDFRSTSAALFEGFRAAVVLHPYAARSRRSQWAPRFFGGWRIAAGLLAGTGIGCVVIAAIFFLGNTRVTWADVVERFKTVKSFSATVYRKDDAISEPRQFELWVGEGGRLRVRVGTQVAFGEKGRLTRAFDLKTRAEAPVDRTPEALVEMLGQDGEFSFDTLIRGITGELNDVTPIANSQAVISEDLVVFDVASARTPEWMRIWALRESRLPVQVRVWDPRDGECTDVFFSYSKHQAAEFYDAEAFASIVTDSAKSPGELAYALLKDPVGRNTSPPEPDEAAVFNAVTTTLDGKPWSMADQKGKAVFIYFWSVGCPSPPATYVYDIYRKFKDRDDFLMVGVPLGGTAEEVRTLCDQWDMRWPQLYEPGRAMSRNTLVNALGVVHSERGVLIWKDGRIDEVLDSHHAGKVEGALLGMTYESQYAIRDRLFEFLKDKNHITRAHIEMLCGKPDSVQELEPGQGGPRAVESWSYRRSNEDNTMEGRLDIAFDGEGHLTGFSAR